MTENDSRIEESPLFGTIISWLKSENWSYEIIPDKQAIRTGVQGRNSAYKVFFRVQEDKQQIHLFLAVEQKVPENKRDEAAEYLMRATWGLQIGNFEFDYSDGEFRYKVAYDVENGRFSTRMVKNMVGISLGTFDRYFPGLMAVTFANVSPQTAISQVESPASNSAAQDGEAS
uniref:YbjN domain-containing protein n=1 Tax=Aureoumbra lagunensis TaxID=44058 RepID=A0A7S3JVS9_9STRA|mmetsp:Transcript_2546/g.3432  ORF Transcript_2546/g.3432 Transcript_2546/m.3432 type:complete len:173 (+) Transcript_2546:42-560(+)|eukprot:CAMPEP_0197290726 /NCGR_PEP_ID=MMETSP0890-20130614/9528_1 /TAXON_ID=44058 ORGANISM="Aureoumbra lagunensis, Strain CCMP1510" /NCGR_SAMPLE_ID=MMETSP0890 /ASSEMBLY_ACC=CAM_ASM_000533 /LENGTH=172 /DNA_ID=CAMNT_0042762955 /DNA_START=21 /DNA_END=542 /DNA_ORIENTATION=+